MNSITRKLADEAATTALGHELSLFVRNGMVICLQGDLGAGKTTLARAIIHGLAKSGESFEVPSPTFSLVQPYDHLRLPVHHYDLYRIDDLDEIYELGLFDDLENRLTIIEWPERLGNDLPKQRLDIRLEISGDQRFAVITADNTLKNIIDRMTLVSTFLEQGVWRDARRVFLQGDASARRYERLIGANGQKAVLMDMPQGPDGPVIQDGKTYSEIAHIAEGIIPVAAVNQTLRQLGFNAPKTWQSDLSNGLMVIEDFGDGVFGHLFSQGQDISIPVQIATELLAEFARKEWPQMARVTESQTEYEHCVSPFDLDAFTIEVSLLVDWFWPLVKGEKSKEEYRQTFFDIWSKLFTLVESSNPVWIMRDFHSPNLIWMPERNTIDRVGLIDTQDCLLGHPAYDLVSMLQDARIDLPNGFETKLYAHYCQLRQQADKSFDEPAFAQAYAILGAQRATKILGIFARLCERDGKPGYLKHIPRVSGYLEQNLQHPVLSDLHAWFQKHLPVEIRSIRDSA